MFLSAHLVECSISLPDVVANNSSLATTIFLERPASIGFVSDDLVQEVTLENGVVGFQPILFGLILHVSEVGIILEVESLRFWETFERLVPGDFVGRCEFHGALRDDMAVIFDRSNVVMEPIDFFEI